MSATEALMKDMPHGRAANAVIHAGFVVTGIVTTLLGPVLPILIARWSISDERAGLFFTLQFCGNLVGIATLGKLISRRGYKPTFVFGFACMAAGVSMLDLGNQLVGLLATAVFGYGLGLILSGTNLWVAEVAASRRAAALSVLNVAWGIGAIACPPLVMIAQEGHQLSQFLLGVASVAALVAVAIGAMDIEPRLQDTVDATAPRVPPAPGKAVFALGCLFFLYVGTENSVGGWTAAFSKRMGMSSGNLWELAPMFFWAGLLVGRALTPLLLRQVSEKALLIAGLILSGVCNGAFLWVATFWSAAVFITATGLGLACVYPLLVAWMVGHFGKQARSTGTILFALAAMGGATLPWLVGFASTRTGSLRAGLLVPLAGCMVMLSLLGLLQRKTAA
jgi:FHS family glucose/mannose:H+ symporter-like MFS transporter